MRVEEENKRRCGRTVLEILYIKTKKAANKIDWKRKPYRVDPTKVDNG